MSAIAIAGSRIYIGWIASDGSAFNAAAASAVEASLTGAGVGVVTSVDFGETTAMHDTTAFGDLAVYRQPGLPDGGDIKLTMIKNGTTYGVVVGNTGTSWRAKTQAATPVPIRLVFGWGGLVAGQPFEYVNAYFVSAPAAGNPNDPQMMDVTLSCSGPVTRGAFT